MDFKESKIIRQSQPEAVTPLKDCLITCHQALRGERLLIVVHGSAPENAPHNGSENTRNCRPAVYPSALRRPCLARLRQGVAAEIEEVANEIPHIAGTAFSIGTNKLERCVILKENPIES